jgi:putative ATP-dependent endonuclease of OLD family
LKLAKVRLSNFQSFGDAPTELELDDLTFLLGPNGAGKTALLQSLARMFSLDPSQRRIRRTDFHVPMDEDPAHAPESRVLWIEADFEFPQLAVDDGNAHPGVPGNFAHMQLAVAQGPAKVRFRLKAMLEDDGEIEESLTYVVRANAHGEPEEEARVQKHERNAIQVHYLPARRDPAEHISYAANALLGRILRAADWGAAREAIARLTGDISDALAGNAAVDGISHHLASHWEALHRGAFYANPSVSFARNEIEGLLRHVTVGFTPGHAEAIVDFSRLSDGQQSLLYVSLVLSLQEIGRKVLAGELDAAFDIDRLRPAVFNLVAMEEPENSLSPHYLGRVMRALTGFAENEGAQAIIATHAPSLLKRVSPHRVRYLRLGTARVTVVKSIVMPARDDEAYKYVREAIQAYPELYFSRFVILGEGDSEEIVLARMLEAKGILADDSSVSVVPLGGRHVNHFWRLLNGLSIPHVTLLDLDLARHQGGWGRVRYAAKQLLAFPEIAPGLTQANIDAIAPWNGPLRIRDSDPGWIPYLEGLGVFFSTPLDLDFTMLRRYPASYDIDEALEIGDPDAQTVSSVLGKGHAQADQYTEEERRHFDAYHSRFKVGSKPVWHLRALSERSDEELVRDMPEVIGRLIDSVAQKLQGLPE